MSAATAVNKEILGTRALAYRRNVLVVGFIMIALVALPGVEFGDLSLYGLKLAKGDNAKWLVLKVLASILAYNVTFFADHLWREFLIWRDEATSPPSPLSDDADGGFRELKMFFSLPPASASSTPLRRTSPPLIGRDWRLKPDQSRTIWIVDTDKGTMVAAALPNSAVRHMRRKLISFTVADVVLTVVVSLVALSPFVFWLF